MTKTLLKRLIWLSFFGIVLATAALAGKFQYTYDRLNRRVQVQYDDGTTIQYAYDAAGNRLVQQVTASTPPPAPAGSQTSGPTATVPLIQNSPTPTPTRSLPFPGLRAGKGICSWDSENDLRRVTPKRHENREKKVN